MSLLKKVSLKSFFFRNPSFFKYLRVFTWAILRESKLIFFENVKKAKNENKVLSFFSCRNKNVSSEISKWQEEEKKSREKWMGLVDEQY